MFTKKITDMAKPLSAARAGNASTFSMLCSDTVIRGDIEASADLHFDGRVEGDITCASFVQGAESEISGNIKADSARIAGRIRGTVTARNVVIEKTAYIEGDVSYDSLTVEQGARIEGRLAPSGGQVPPAIGKQDKPVKPTLVDAAE